MGLGSDLVEKDQKALSRYWDERYRVANSYKIKMAEYRIGQDPDVFICTGLGSCIGIVLYERINRIGGLAHTMLPRQLETSDNSNPAKFVNSAIEVMLEQMKSLGASQRCIVAKIFGGAEMFPNVNSSTLLRVGARNVAAVRDELTAKKIKVVEEDLGGNTGRSIYLDTKDGAVRVRTTNGEERLY